MRVLCGVSFVVGLWLFGACTGSSGLVNKAQTPTEPTVGLAARGVQAEPVVVTSDGLVVDDPNDLIVLDDGVFVVPGRIVVVAETGGDAGMTTAAVAAEATGGIVVGASSRLGVYQLQFPSDTDPSLSEQLVVIEAQPGVVAAGLSRGYPRLDLQVWPPDEQDEMWDDHDVLWPFEVLGLDELWEIQGRSSADDVGVLIADWAILDSHPELGFTAPVKAITDEPPNQRLLWDITQVGHGTGVAGVACGHHDGNGTFGVADGCGLYGLDLVYSLTGEFEQPLTTAMSFAVLINQMLIDNPDIKIVNASWGIGPNPYGGCADPADPIDVWVLYRLMLEHPDVLFVAAAGNCTLDVPIVDSPFDLSKQPVQFPAGAAPFLDNVIAVTAINEDLTLADFANAGPAVDVAAPGGVSNNGEYIWAPSFDCANGSCDPTYVPVQGTSIAAPWVSGIAALMFQANPTLTATQAKQCIAETASTPVLPASHNRTTVDGINVASPTQAVQCAINLSQPVELDTCFDFSTRIQRRATLLGLDQLLEEIPLPLWACNAPINKLDCPTGLGDKLAPLWENTERIAWCIGEPGFKPTLVPPKPTAEPEPDSLADLEDPSQLPDWAEQYWENPPVPVQLTNLGVENKPAFRYLRSLPEVNGLQLLLVQTTFDLSYDITIVSVTNARAEEDTRLYVEGEPREPDRGYAFYLGPGTNVTFDPDPNIRDCAACRPATSDDIKQLQHFITNMIEQAN